MFALNLFAAGADASGALLCALSGETRQTVVFLLICVSNLLVARLNFPRTEDVTNE